MGRSDNHAGEALAITDTPDAAVAMLRGESLPEFQNPEEAQRDIMEQIFSATNADDVLGSAQTQTTESMVGIPFLLEEVKLLKSGYGGDTPVFAVLTGTLADNGEKIAITSSSKKVMTQAVQLWRLDALPRPVMIEKSAKQTASGFFYYWLVTPGE